jgi:hypothetical protein
MTMSADIRRVWRLNWLGCLQEFSDVNEQRRNWLDPMSTNPHWSFVEIMSCYFDDALYGQGYAYLMSQGLVSQQEADAVATLHRLLERYKPPGGASYAHARILEDASWGEVTAAAAETVSELLKILVDPTERAACKGDPGA